MNHRQFILFNFLLVFFVTKHSSTLLTSSGFEHFGQKLFSTVSQDQNGKNVFLSPASISLAMSMCAEGARQETLNQMLNVLEASSTGQLTKIAEQVMKTFCVAAHDKQLQLKLANRLYAEKAFELRPDYVKLLQKSFQADIKLVDFEKESANAIQTINGWVEQKTNKLIQNLLSSDDVTPDTKLIIVNCIYFKGIWVYQFNETLTNENADFHGINGQISKIKLMHQKAKYAYTENKDLQVQVAHLPYKNDNAYNQFVFTIVLPNEGVQLEDVEKKLASSPDLMQNILSADEKAKQELLVYIPKFKMEAKFQLNDVLIKLGMKDAFDPSKANFAGIVKKDEDAAGLYISKVVHKAFIDVNEQGSEAAAATAVVLTRGRPLHPESNPIEFKADRPFLFFIREVRRNIVLFSGRFTSPTS